MSVEKPADIELQRLQSWMQAVITHSGGVREGLLDEAARQYLPVTPDHLEEVISPSATLTGAQRLALYQQSYHLRLLQCFQAVFPALRQALGAALFNRFVADYLHHHPPQSYTLDEVADAFPQHLADTRPDADAPPEERESWPDFLIELATLELAFMKIYDGAGNEGHTLPDVTDSLRMPTSEWLGAKYIPAPCLRSFALRYPAHTYLLDVRQGKSCELPAPRQSFLALTRRNYKVMLYELSASQYMVLQTLDGQRTIGEALEALAPVAASDSVQVATLREWLTDWLAKGFFQRLENPPPANL